MKKKETAITLPFIHYTVYENTFTQNTHINAIEWLSVGWGGMGMGFGNKKGQINSLNEKDPCIDK